MNDTTKTPNPVLQNTQYTYQGESSRLLSTSDKDLQRPHKGAKAKPAREKIPVK